MTKGGLLILERGDVALGYGGARHMTSVQQVGGGGPVVEDDAVSEDC